MSRGLATHKPVISTSFTCADSFPSAELESRTANLHILLGTAKPSPYPSQGRQHELCLKLPWARSRQLLGTISNVTQMHSGGSCRLPNSASHRQLPPPPASLCQHHSDCVITYCSTLPLLRCPQACLTSWLPFSGEQNTCAGTAQEMYLTCASNL